jgi:hypothetical protein
MLAAGVTSGEYQLTDIPGVVLNSLDAKDDAKAATSKRINMNGW